MSEQGRTVEAHVGELLSGFLDGELTQQIPVRGRYESLAFAFPLHDQPHRHTLHSTSCEHPQRQLQRLADQLQELFPLNLSAKHMAHREMGRLEPTPSLKHKAA